MPFDAAGLWWPVLSRLYDTIVQVAYLGGKPPQGFDAELQKREPLLLANLLWFKQPNKASRDALSSETFLDVGGNKKIPIAKDMVDAALELSLMLGLDEVQSYILLRRVLGEERARAGQGLNPEQRQRLLAYYWRERTYLLKCTETLLDYAFRNADKQTFLVSTVTNLLNKGLKALMNEVLNYTVGYATNPDTLRGGNPKAPAPPASDPDLATGQAMRETCNILDNMLFIFQFPQQTCSVERWLDLAGILRAILARDPGTAESMAAQGGGLAVAADMRRAQFLGSLLLIFNLNVDAALRLVGNGKPVAKAHPYAGSKQLAAIDNALKGWWKDCAPAEALVLLAWAAFQSLLAPEGNRAPSSGPLQHADHAVGGLGSVAALTEIVTGAGTGSRIYCSILKGLLSSLLVAFQFSPSSLSASDLASFARIMAGIYSEAPDGCVDFWRAQSTRDFPVHKSLNDARSLFPALPLPLLSLLPTVSAGQAGTQDAYAYLGNISHVAVVHRIDDPALDDESSSSVTAVRDVPVPGFDWTVIPQGSRGEVVPLPQAGVHVTKTLEFQGVDPEKLILVRWQLDKPPAFIGLYLLQGRMALCIKLLRQGGDPEAMGIAVAELAAAVHLVACFGKASPAVIFQLFQLEHPDSRGTILTLLLQTLDVLMRQPQPHLQAMGECLAVAASLAQTLPAAVLHAVGQTPLLRSEALRLPGGTAPDAAELRIPGLQALHQGAEGQAGTYPVTLGFLDLVVTLVEGGLSSVTLQAYVSHVMGHVLPSCPAWRYVGRSQRWELVSGGLRVLRAALAASPNPGPVQHGSPDKDLRSVVSQTLGLPGTLEALLLGGLPPDAVRLDAMLDTGLLAEVASAESAVLEWFLLIPLLLPALQPLRALCFFQAPTPDSPSPAQTLASYLAYQHFSSTHHAQGFAALAALCEASIRAGHRMTPGDIFPATQGSAARDQLQAALISPLRYPVALTEPDLFEPAARVLECALSGNPGLADALLTPRGFSEEGFGQPAAEGDTEKPAKRGAGPKALPRPDSALDGLWGCLRESGRLRVEQPRSLAALLRLLLAMWQAGHTAFRPLHLLRQLPGFWDAIGACLPDPGDGPPLPDEAVDEGLPEPWLGSEDEVWRVSAEACALHIISAEAFSHPDRQGEPRSGVWDLIASWAQKPYDGFLPGLLQRYAGPAVGGALMMRAKAEADEAVASLFSAVLKHEQVRSAFLAPGSFLEAIAPKPSGPESQTLEGLSTLTGAQLQRSGTGLLLFSAAEARGVACSGNPPYGQGYLYCAQTLAWRCGVLLSEHLEPLRDFLEILRALSLMASYEDARMGALRALHTTLALTLRAVHVPREALMDSWEALQQTLQPCMDDLATGRDPGEGLGINAVGITFDAAWQIAQCNLMMLQKLAGGPYVRDARHGSASSDAEVNLASSIVTLTRLWLTAERALTGAETLGSAPGAMSGTLIAACMLALQRVHADVAKAHEGPALGLQDALERLVIPLAGFCQRPGPNQAAAITLLTKTSGGALPSSDWLLALDEAKLNLVELLDEGLSEARKSAAESKGAPKTIGYPTATSAPAEGRDGDAALGSTLLLLLQVAQNPKGARLLEEQGIMERCVGLAHHLLSSSGSGLAGSSDARGGSGADYAGAYSSDGRPTPAHEQWCSLLALVALQLRAMAGREEVRRGVLAFLVAAEDRLMRALEPPASTPAQPLTLAMLQETERTCFLLTALSAMPGEWQLALPHSPPAARSAAATLLTYVVLPYSQPGFRVFCPPISPSEKALAAQPPGLPLGEAWFGVCAEGSAEGAGALPEGSAFSVRLAEQVYTCATQALAFLCVCLPEVSEEEVAYLGPSWPSIEDLVDLQKQAMALSYDACEGAAEGDLRARRLAGTLLSILRFAGNLLDRMFAAPDSTHVACAREAAARLHAATKGSASPVKAG